MSTPTQTQYDAAFKAAMPIVNAEIADQEKAIPVFIRPQATKQIEAHRAEIETVVKAIVKAAVDAAAQTPAG